jgi:plasmid stabilization system protein ParE
MVAELIMAPEAEQDLDEAYAWYEKQRAGLGGDFLDRVDACLNAICRTPLAHQVVHADFRRTMVRRFPYAIYYEFADAKVIVYGIVHTSKDPDKWRQRLS